MANENGKISELEISALEKKLQLQRRGALPPYHKLYISLIRRLNENSIDDVLKNKLIDSLNSGNLHSLDNNVLEELKNKIISLKFNEYDEYIKYCNIIRNGYKDILSHYQDYSKGKQLPFISPLYYARYGHFYTNEEYRDQPEVADFITLVNRLASINPSYIDRLIENNLFNTDSFGYSQQRALTDALYELFSKVETDYFRDLKKIDDAYIDKIKNNKKPEHFINLDGLDFDNLYINIVYGSLTERDAAIAKLKAPVPLNIEKRNLKLAYDLEQIRDDMQARKKRIQAQLKALKKDIHHVAQYMGLESRIVDRVVDPNAKPYFYLSTYEVAPPGDSRVKGLIHVDKQQARQTKSGNKALAKWVAMIVGLGEGLVATAGIVAAFPAAPFVAVFLTVGLAGWYCNYFLFGDDTEFTLRELFVMKEAKKRDGSTGKVRSLFVNEKGEEMGPERLAISIIFGLGSFGTGIVYGSLSFLSVLAALPASLGVGAILLAAFPATATAIGITSILFTVISSFIKNDGWNAVYNYFKNTYFNRPWGEMGVQDWVGYVAGAVFNLSKLALALGVNVVITVASLGMLHGKALEVLSKICSPAASDKIGWTAAVMNAIVHAPFGIKNVIEPIELLFSFFRTTYAKLDTVSTPEERVLQKSAKIPTHVATQVGMGAALANGLGQAALVALALVSNVLKATVTAVSGVIYSAGPNTVALRATLSKSEVMPTSTHTIVSLLPSSVSSVPESKEDELQINELPRGGVAGGSPLLGDLSMFNGNSHTVIDSSGAELGPLPSLTA